jgi:predicted nucleotidyltransferase/DNA-binding HxlR family transcriptional regulator
MSLVDDYSFLILSNIKAEGTTRFKDLETVVRNPKTLTAKLRNLTEKGLIESTAEGYRLTLSGREAANILERLDEISGRSRFSIKNVERVPHRLYADLIERYCEILHDRYRGRLVSIALFGSVARGNWEKDSDIDLIIIIEGWKNTPVWMRIRELQELRRALSETPEFKSAIEKGFTPNIQHYPLDLSEASKFHRIYIDASIDAIVLYDKQDFLKDLLNNLRIKLERQGARRVTAPRKGYYWILKEVKLGEVFAL